MSESPPEGRGDIETPTGGRPDDAGGLPGAEAGAEAERRRRRALVFGDVLPETTSDDRADDVPPDAGGTDAWLRREVPPHHGT